MNAYKDIYDSALLKMNQYIEEHRLKSTQEREIILKHICRLQHPVTTAEMVEIMEKEHICRATVYNTMKLLTQANVLIEQYLQTSVRSKVYQLHTERQSQIQMLCTRCGRVVNLKDEMLSSIISNKKYNNFNFRRYALFVYGECKSCRRKKK